MNLAYLFECHLKDGTMIQQTPEDVSVIDPAKSAFYDVLQRINDVVALVSTTASTPMLLIYETAISRLMDCRSESIKMT